MTEKFCQHCNTNHPNTPEYWTRLPRGQQCKAYKRLVAKRWRTKHKEKHRAYTKEYNLKNSEWKKESDKQWRLKNKEHKNKRDLEYVKLRKSTDIGFRVRLAVRSRLRDALKGRISIRTQDLLGCSSEFLVKWLESKWKDGMSWENYGKEWHIDHILPLASFDLTHEDQLKAASHYTNLQPLWAKENQQKGARLNFQ